VFAEVFDLGLVLQWDRGTRVYIRADPKWKNKVSLFFRFLIHSLGEVRKMNAKWGSYVVFNCLHVSTPKLL
jgi:hypothetical protein